MIISTIILAAGESKRFQENKLLQIIELEKPIDSRKRFRLIEFLIIKYLENPEVNDVVVVVGYRPLDIIEALKNLDIKFVYNPEYGKGMSYSVKKGIRAIYKYADIAIIHPGDVPFIDMNTIRELISYAIKLYRDREDFIVLPSYEGKKGGHPLIVSKNLIPYILSINEETRGLKGFLNKFSNKKKYVITSDLGVLYDIDTPDDLVRAEKIFGIKWLRSSS